MILSDRELYDLVFIKGMVTERSHDDIPHSNINPASIDIRVGAKCLCEESNERMIEVDLSKIGGDWFAPGQFALIETYETFNVPNDIALDLRLKSSMARLGWDHSLAFWVDPGWRGVLTMEIRNATQYTSLFLKYGQRFAQVIAHQLSSSAMNPYNGQYQNATEVERAKP